MNSRYCGRRLEEGGASPSGIGSERRRPGEAQTSTLLRASNSLLLGEELMTKLVSTTASPQLETDCKMVSFVDIAVVGIEEQSVVAVVVDDVGGEVVEGEC